MTFIEAMEKVQKEGASVRPIGVWYEGYVYVTVVGSENKPTLFTTTGVKDFVPTFFDFTVEWELYDDRPEKHYNVEMCRIGYGSRIIVVKARSREEAQNKAEDQAGDYEYNEKHSEYEVQGVWEI
jgi:hypothetical protein